MSSFRFIFLGFSLIVFFLNSFGQEFFSNYEDNFFNHAYAIDVSFEDSSDYEIWIEAKSLDADHRKCGMVVTKSQHEDFLNVLDSVQEKYSEWVEVAKKNNVNFLVLSH